ncbi:unnamed protein product [Lepeophtheirus salmonis]|uniref:(salmon louse) hypothetical protein n=1 Tax=Lepeophtheirus salmonis TaxID=72036 RepID=A0A7R8H4G1_LEPSM|nr:unnamed protein product [Lepeophtheirus salmonis]CAF2860027.1 unnamed protein product [Lepeophtheirus salmonis]
MPRRKKEDEIPGERPPPRGAANARERTRMRRIQALRTLQPSPSTASYFDHDSQINLHCWPYGHHLRNSSSNGHNNSISSDNPKPEPHFFNTNYIDYNSHTGASSQDLAHYELAYDSSLFYGGMIIGFGIWGSQG